MWLSWRFLQSRTGVRGSHFTKTFFPMLIVKRIFSVHTLNFADVLVSTQSLHNRLRLPRPVRRG